MTASSRLRKQLRGAIWTLGAVLALGPASAQETADLQQQLHQLKQQYEQTTRDLQQRIALLEQQIQKHRERQAEKEKASIEKPKETTISAAKLAAEGAEKAVAGQSDQVGARFQGQIPSEPSYDLLKEADQKIAKLQEHVGEFEFHGYFRSGYGLNSAGGQQVAFEAPGRGCEVPSGKRNGNLRRIDLCQQLAEPGPRLRQGVDEDRVHGGGQHDELGQVTQIFPTVLVTISSVSARPSSKPATFSKASRTPSSGPGKDTTAASTSRSTTSTRWT